MEQDASTRVAKLGPAQAAAEMDSPLARALKVLETVYEAVRPLSSLDIARRCDLDPSTAHRLIQNLASCGYLVRDEDSKRYLAHPRMLFPLPLYHPIELVRRDCSPVVLNLRDRLSLTSGFVLFYCGARVLLDLAPGRDPLNPDNNPIKSTPLHATASGKAFLLSLTPKQRAKILGKEPLESFTEKTLTSLDQLEDDLQLSRSRGYIVSFDDYMNGFRVVAAPVGVGEHVVGCFFCSGGTATLSERNVDEVGRELAHAAGLFSKATPNLRLLLDLLDLEGGK